MPTLFNPVDLGELHLSNRIVMAPMTRSRSGEGDVPTALNVEYYRQRGTAGMIISEGTQPSAHGKGYCRTPGIHSAAQIQGWRAVTDAVHKEGAKMVLQLMHCGRISSRHNKAPDTETVAPSAIQAAGQMYTDAKGMVDFDAPRALTSDEVPQVIAEYRQATVNALEAGFDGVELHGMSGYLPMQFLCSKTNLRTDCYGGSAQNRCRFVLEALHAMSAIAGAGRVGLRICPGNTFNDIDDENPLETFTVLLQALNPLRLAYLHLVYVPNPRVDGLQLARELYQGPLILNESINFDRGQELVSSGVAAAISFARSFLANPDLVRRFREGHPLAKFDRKTLYTPGPQGYTDYPSLL